MYVIAQVNAAEAEFWRRSQGNRVDFSDRILGFECGGQQWVNEVSFPVGTLEEPNGKDLDYMVRQVLQGAGTRMYDYVLRRFVFQVECFGGKWPSRRREFRLVCFTSGARAQYNKQNRALFCHGKLTLTSLRGQSVCCVVALFFPAPHSFAWYVGVLFLSFDHFSYRRACRLS